MSKDAVQAQDEAWKAYAEACCQHDPERCRLAAAELKRLLPTPRPVEGGLTPTKG